MSDDTFNSPAVAAYLGDCDLESFDFEIKALGQTVKVYRWRVN